MNRFSFLALALTLILSLAARVHSQSTVAPKNPAQQLQALKAANQAQLEKQTALLLKLDELQKEAAQIKFLAKRG